MKESHWIFASLRILGRFSHLNHQTKLTVWAETLGCYLILCWCFWTSYNIHVQQIYPRILKGVRQDYPAVQTNIFLKRWKSKDIIMHNADDWWKLGLKLSSAPHVSLHDIYSSVEILCVDVPFPDPKLSYCKPLPLNKPIFYFFNVT